MLRHLSLWNRVLFTGVRLRVRRALVQRKVRDVFVALIDPHPKNRGRGIQILKDANIPVQVGLLEEEAERDLGHSCAQALVHPRCFCLFKS